MGYTIDSFKIAANQNSRVAEVYANLFRKGALMDKNQLLNVSMIDSEQKKDIMKLSNYRSIRCGRVEPDNTNVIHLLLPRLFQSEQVKENMKQDIRRKKKYGAGDGVERRITEQLMLEQQYRSFVGKIDHPLELAQFEVIAISHGREADLLVVRTEGEHGVLMGYTIDSLKIASNQNFQVAEDYTNLFIREALMDKNQLISISMVNLE
jgi:hypothetical protein